MRGSVRFGSVMVSAARSFDESIRLLEQLFRTDIQPAGRVGLARAEYLLSRLGDPHRAFRSVHVTGSTGKGSTTTMVGNILRAGGFRTGFFRSPHLQSYRERMSIDGQDITEEQWVRHFNGVWPVVESMAANQPSGYTLGRPSFFEVMFALGSRHFASEGVEWAAMEAGMGGRLDATNTVDSEVAVITNVSLEHTKILGSTVRAIAQEKAAILKAGSVAVTASTHPDALEIIDARSRTLEIPLLRVPDDVTASIERFDLTGQAGRLRLPGREVRFNLPVLGDFQVTNAATAAAAAVALESRGVPLADELIARGLAQTRIPGRLEVISTDPLIILDGAHSPAAAEELARSIPRLLDNRSVTLVFAALADKDVDTMARHLAGISRSIIVTTAPDERRAAPPLSLATAFERAGVCPTVVEDPVTAFQDALAQAGSDDAVIITGSLYLVGLARTVVAPAGALP